MGPAAGGDGPAGGARAARGGGRARGRGHDQAGGHARHCHGLVRPRSLVAGQEPLAYKHQVDTRSGSYDDYCSCHIAYAYTMHF